MSVNSFSLSISVNHTFGSQPKPPDLSWDEKQALNKLLSMPFDPVLDSNRYWDFRDFGQALFNKFNCPIAAKESLTRILNSIPFNCYQNGQRLKEHVNKAWEGVGDAKWQWGRF